MTRSRVSASAMRRASSAAASFEFCFSRGMFEDHVSRTLVPGPRGMRKEKSPRLGRGPLGIPFCEWPGDPGLPVLVDGSGTIRTCTFLLLFRRDRRPHRILLPGVLENLVERAHVR